MMSTLPDLRTRDAIQSYLRGLAAELGVSLGDPRLAAELDKRDKLAEFRSKFHVPIISDFLEEGDRAEDVDVSQEIVYMTGNSLGLQPKGAKEHIDREMDKWARMALRGHHCGKFPWLPIEDFLVEESARIVGAKPIEVAVMNSLSVNIHLGLAAFYQPTKERWRILMEEKAFPSDHYAVESQVRWHGYDPKSTLIFATEREGGVWQTEDIVRIIEEQGDTIALVYFSGIHFSTGHMFDMKAITEAAHKKGCYVGFDLAHAAGNVELHLHDWNVDFACWCTYKYMNAGPGGVAGFFVHEKHAHNSDLPRLLGWWSHKRDTRFVMDNILDLQPGAAGFQLSNPPVLQCMLLRASLDVFSETSMEEICVKSRILTGYLELLLEEYLGKRSASQNGVGNHVEVMTSSDPCRRGAQLSLKFSCPIKEVHSFLERHGVMTDLRDSNLMRVAPAPLYNSFTDVFRMYTLLKQALEGTK